jgi:hypothetical protein
MGNKKALLIGCNYRDSLSPLNGCCNDARNMKKFISTQWKFPVQNIKMLIDEAENELMLPTRRNMIKEMHWLVAGAQAGDSLLVHFSGHGGQQKDKSGDEADGMDETICPMDYQRAGVIVDDELFEILVRPLPPGCRLTAVFDCCHSGSALDLPYSYDCSGHLIDEPRTGGRVAPKVSAADVIMVSGCRDDQTSADALIAQKHTGAISYALITTLSETPRLSFLDLLRRCQAVMKEKRFTQIPQLSSCRQMDMSYPFIM